MNKPTDKKVVIPVDPANVEKFLKWCAFYGMTVKKKKLPNWEVSNYNDIDLFWLGCNMNMTQLKK